MSPPKATLGLVVASFAFRAACAAVMLWLALWREVQHAPTLPDWVLDHVPYVAWVDRWNYFVWLLAYVPVALALLVLHRDHFVRYMVSSGLVSLVRGVCIAVTGLGPVNGQDLHAGMGDDARWRAFWHLVNPVAFFQPDSGAQVTLTKDLFFSGHTSTTFLLLLYVWPFRSLRWVMLGLHLAVVATVFLAHMHYTIDVLGAYAMTFSVFMLREGALRASFVVGERPGS